jgi:uncharacterized protein YjbI with pentapeptide repeats
MNEERMHILKMLQEGKITVDEAAKLIEALGNQPTADVSTLIPVTNETQPARVVGAAEQLRPRFRWSMLNFLFSNLEGAIVDGGFYEGARILCSNLNTANLRTGNFQEAWVLCANLESANFEGANLEGAKIIASNLDHADFRGADLRDTVILCANFDHADFRGADLRGKTFVGVSMAGYKTKEVTVPVTLEA